VVYRAESADVLETYVAGKRVRERGQPAPQQALGALAHLLSRLRLP
jgi:hypothetical protein